MTASTTDTITTLRQQLLQLRELHDGGLLDTTSYDNSRTPLEQQLLAAVLAAQPQAQPPERRAAATPRVPTTVWAAAGAGIVTIAAIGYWWTTAPGASGQSGVGWAAAAAPGQAASAPHAMGGEQVEAMVAQLAARMEQTPDNVDGWGMLGRSYMALGRTDQALKAYERALKLRPDDATTLADYADALGLKNGRKLEGEPAKVIAKALRLEPDNLKALTLAGTLAMSQGDFATATKHWDRAVKVGPADSSLVETARSGAAEARQRGKLPPATESADAARALPATPGVKGTVRLAAALKGQVGADDTVFIFARPAEGSRMPLAIIRKRAQDLPVEFMLDDSTSMSPAAKLSGAKQVVVGARISKSGQAMPQPGDLEGLSATVDVGASGVVVEISAKRP